MKKALLFLLCLGTVFSVTACGNAEDGGNQTAENITPDKVNIEYEKTKNMALANNDNTVEIKKENFDNSETEPQADISSKKNTGSQNSSTQKKSSEKASNFNETEYQQLGEKLLKELENITTTKITVINEGNGSVVEMTDMAEIDTLKKSLKIEQWQIGHYTLVYDPTNHIYFDDNLCVSFSGQTDKESWLSIHTLSEYVWFRVPMDVYNTLVEKYVK